MKLSIPNTLVISILVAYAFWHSFADGEPRALVSMREMINDVGQLSTPSPSRHQLSVKRLMGKLSTLVYALESTYLPNNATLQKWGASDSDLPNFLEPDENEVPPVFKQFFSATGETPIEGAEKEGYDCANTCLEKPDKNAENSVAHLARAGEVGEQLSQLKSLSANCSELFEDVNCLAQCKSTLNSTNGQSNYVDFLHANTDKLTNAWCKDDPEGTVDVDVLVSGCDIGASPLVMAEFVWQKGLNFVDTFLNADGNSERCDAIKQTLIDEFSKAMQELCENDQEVDTMAQFAAGYILALNTNGEIIEKCPQLYTLDDNGDEEEE